MRKKIFSENVIVATSQYYTTELTKNMLLSLKQDGINFTSLVLFDGTPEEKIRAIRDMADISIVFKNPIHSLPEILNCLINIAKTTDAEYFMFADNDLEFKKGSFKSMLSTIGKYDAVSPIKIDQDRERFEAYCSDEDPIEVIGWNDGAWLVKLNKLPMNPFDRRYGPYGFEDAPVIYKLWRNNLTFAVEPKAVVYHYCSQDTACCFSPENRKRYSDEWDTKAKYFRETNDISAEWFFKNVIMNEEACKRFGFPAYIIKQ